MIYNANLPEHFQFTSNGDGLNKLEGWQCKTCKSIHTTRRAAQTCFLQGFNPEFNPGDIVVVAYALDPEGHGELGWIGDGHGETGCPAWVMYDKPDGGFHDHRHIALYYVVTAVTTDPDDPDEHHEPVYHLVSRATKFGCGIPYHGWTRHGTHTRMVLAPNPPAEVVRQGRRFVGFRTGRLL